MTPLRKRVIRRTEQTIRDGGKSRRLVVTLYPAGYIGLRLEACRREETITIDAVYWSAIKARVSREQREKPQRKKRQRMMRRS